MCGKFNSRNNRGGGARLCENDKEEATQELRPCHSPAVSDRLRQVAAATTDVVAV